MYLRDDPANPRGTFLPNGAPPAATSTYRLRHSRHVDKILGPMYQSVDHRDIRRPLVSEGTDLGGVPIRSVRAKDHSLKPRRFDRF